MARSNPLSRPGGPNAAPDATAPEEPRPYVAGGAKVGPASGTVDVPQGAPIPFTVEELIKRK
jgi:hypothetical protein